MSIYIGNNKYKEIYLGSNKISEIYLGSNKIFTGSEPGPEPSTVLIYSNNTESTATDVTNTYNVNLRNYPFTLFQISQRVSQNLRTGKGNMWLEFNGISGTWPAHSANVWQFRTVTGSRKYQPIRCCQLYTDTNPADWCNDLQSNVTIISPQDNETLYHYKQSSPDSITYAVHSLLINNSTGIAKHYIDGNYTCSGNLVTGGVFTAIAKVMETRIGYYYKDIYIYGSSNESDLLNIIIG